MKEILSPDLEAILKTLRENGFYLFDWMDGNKFPPVHLVRFDGDFPDEGIRAAELVVERGFNISHLRYVWDYHSYLHDFDPGDPTEDPDHEVPHFWEMICIT